MTLHIVARSKVKEGFIRFPKAPFATWLIKQKQGILKRVPTSFPSVMADRRRAEIEEKKAKLAELRRARDERRVQLSLAEAGAAEVRSICSIMHVV